MSSGVKSMGIIAVDGSGRGWSSPVAARTGQFMEPNRREQPSISGRDEYSGAR